METGNGRGPGGGRNGPGGPGHVVLVGTDNRIIASYDDEMIGRKIHPDLVDQGVPLESEGQRIGTILAGPLLSAELNQSERQFLDSVNRKIIYAGLIGLVVAFLLGWLLIRQLTHPLNRLTRATEKVASGDLKHRVSVDSNDELGGLAQSFNRMTENLEESEEIRRRMIGDIAHELRTPLTILSGEVEAIREGIYEPTEDKLEEIGEDLELLSRLVEDLRELALAEAGELKLNREKTDLVDLVERVGGKLAELGEENGIELQIELPKTLPPLRLDGDRIAQVINNLVKNAFRHTETGGEVWIRLEDRSGQAVIEVSDTGEGIPKDKLKHVFDRFYRADSSRSGAGGSGLGLSIAKELVEAHGGKIWIESELGAGTTVGFSLPK